MPGSRVTGSMTLELGQRWAGYSGVSHQSPVSGSYRLTIVTSDNLNIGIPNIPHHPPDYDGSTN